MKSVNKIVMFGHKRIPSREGGVEVVVEELSTRMVKQGYNVTCLNRKGHHVAGSEFDSEETNSYNGIKLKYIPTINKKGLSALVSSILSSIVSSLGDYDVVHIHAEGPAVLCWLPKLFGKKVVVTIHGLDWNRNKWGGFASTYIKLGEKMAAKYADEIIVLSENNKTYFKTVYNRDTTYISNGVNEPIKYTPSIISTKYNLRTNEYILFLGRIVPEKGIHYLIESYKKIKTDKKLVIAGGSSDTDNYYIKLKAEANSNIIFTGFVQGRELAELYSNAYIYCLPSDLEGMPLSLLEAMSYGNCCLVSDIKECSEVVEDHGVLFKKGNIEELAQKLQELIDNKKMTQSYKDSAQNFILRKYNWDDVVDATLSLYKGD